MPQEKLAPIRICWVKALMLGIGTVPLDSVSIMESVIHPTRALLLDVQSTLYCV